MNRTKFALRPMPLTVMAIGLSIAAGSAVAQESKEITVEAPRLVREQVGRSSIGAPIELVTLTHRVKYTDLDLKKSADAAELTKRIDVTARLACKQLETIYPLVQADPDCVKKAIDGAMVQASAAIAAAQGG